MGYFRHHALIVTGSSPDIEAAHKKAAEIFPEVSNILSHIANGGLTFFVPPDGSKEGWETSNEGDKRRAEMIQWLEEQLGQFGYPSCYWTQVQFSDDNDITEVIESPCVAWRLKNGSGEWNKWRALLPNSKVALRNANFDGWHLDGVDLSNADLSRASFRGASLKEANLSGAVCEQTDFSGADLQSVDFSNTVFDRTIFGDIDLSSTKGLACARHAGPSTVGVDTLFKSLGQIPDEFLRETGLPSDVIDVVRSICNGPPIQWHSCFISYSTKDEDFAIRLHSRMRQANIRVWFAPKDLIGGKKLHEQLFSAIQLQEKLLLVLSPHSVQSEWVMTEIRKAREIEKRENRRKLFPIRLVDFDAIRRWSCFDAEIGKDLAIEVREYFIPDFSNWKDHVAFEEAFARLQEALRSEV